MMRNENDSPLPQDAESCVGLGRDEQLYDYYNGVLVGDAAREFEAHLLDCFACRRKVATLDLINETLRSELMPRGEESSPGEEAGAPEPAQQCVAAGAAAGRATPYHLILGGLRVLGGLGVLGVLGVGAVKLIKYARQT
ncbi:MAG TPA: zf-HC2 domain-containing protein [Pyrinomonadaceae bacterium]